MNECNRIHVPLGLNGALGPDILSCEGHRLAAATMLFQGSILYLDKSLHRHTVEGTLGCCAFVMRPEQQAAVICPVPQDGKYAVPAYPFLLL